ncbi:nitroreductase family protein [bacterium]|nr:nitroreductase family protein [bacterium]
MPEIPVHRLISARRSARAFDPRRPVEDEKISAILEAARWAPSCANRQSWRYVVCRGSSLAALRDCLNPGNYWAVHAPLIAAAVTRSDLGCRITGRDYAGLDLGLSMESLILQCVAEGLIGHPIAGFDEEKAKTALAIPSDHRIFALIIVGYPGSEDILDETALAKEKAPRTRLPPEETVFWEGWGKPRT